MRPRLLVVDDPAIRHLVSELLTGEGYVVEAAGDGEGALDCIAQIPPDLIISDVNMPRRDGLSLLQNLRRAGITIPMVLMSALPVRTGVAAVPILAKPFDLEILLRQVTQLIAITQGTPHHDE